MTNPERIAYYSGAKWLEKYPVEYRIRHINMYKRNRLDLNSDWLKAPNFVNLTSTTTSDPFGLQENVNQTVTSTIAPNSTISDDDFIFNPFNEYPIMMAIILLLLVFSLLVRTFCMHTCQYKETLDISRHPAVSVKDVELVAMSRNKLEI